MSMSSVVAGRPDPASWLDGASVLKIPRKGPGQPAIPLPIGDRLRPVTIEDMRRIHPLHRTAPAVADSRVQDRSQEGARHHVATLATSGQETLTSWTNFTKWRRKGWKPVRKGEKG